MKGKPFYLALIGLILTLAAAPLGKPPLSTIVSGRIVMVQGDLPTGEPVPPQFYLVDSRQNLYRLLISPATVERLGGPWALDGARAVVSGKWLIPPLGVLAGASLTPLLQVEASTIQPRIETQASLMVGSYPWVTILCKFSDMPTEPEPKSFFQTLMGDAFPGLNHYWKEVSYNRMNINGSIVVGWYTMDKPFSYYVVSKTADLYKLANDCTAKADPYVNFANFRGVNMMFNADSNIFGSAWGSWGWPLNRDGVTTIPMTWMHITAYHSQWVVAHEMGHGFGLRHSSGPYGKTYDSYWSVMSGGGAHRFYRPPYGFYGVHPIAYHKSQLGWIPTDRIYEAPRGSSATITLERLGELPSTGGTYLMAKIPLPNSTTRFYTLEARRKLDNLANNDHEEDLPGTGTLTNNNVYEGIIIHLVDTTLSDRNAQVVDRNDDGNQNVNDLSAVWTPNETFMDADNRIQVSVISATSTGFQVYISNGGVSNDSRDQATVISSYPFTQVLITKWASVEESDPYLPETCVGGPATQGQASVWFKYTAPLAKIMNGKTIIHTAGSGYDTILALWELVGGQLVLRACNDDAMGTTSRLEVETPFREVTDYYIEVVGKQGGGNLKLSFDFVPCYPLTLQVEPPGAGQIVVNPPPNCNGGYYLRGTVVTLEAQPLDDGLAFLRWQGAVNGRFSPISVQVNGWQMLRAMFRVHSPLLLSPDGGEIITTLQPNLSWTEVSGATGYRLQIALDSTFLSPWYDTEVNAASLDLPVPLQPQTLYYWRVQTIRGALRSGWSRPSTFLTP